MLKHAVHLGFPQVEKKSLEKVNFFLRLVLCDSSVFLCQLKMIAILQFFTVDETKKSRFIGVVKQNYDDLLSHNFGTGNL